MKRLVGIYREKQFSPGRHESNDSLLLEMIATRLCDLGCEIDLITIAGAKNAPQNAALVFSMCQGRESLLRLAEWEGQGIRIMNRPNAALNTHRDHLSSVLERAKIPFPKTHLFETANGDNSFPSLNGSGLWLKRGDVHASVGADVQWLASVENLQDAIAGFRARGITHAAVQAHCAGDEIKFYGIGESGFFHWFYSRRKNGFSADENALIALARRAATAAGLTIFGGDVIVDADGNLTLIDLNDWPSFAPCRETASAAIADLIRREVDVA